MKIIITGNPIAKARPRFFRKGNFVGAYSSQRTEEGRWLSQAAEQIDLPFPNECPLSVSMCFFMPIPKSTSKKLRADMVAGKIPHMKKSDLDNLVKFVLDCLNGVAWDDDRQIVALQAYKQYDERPRTEIYIQEEAICDKK